MCRPDDDHDLGIGRLGGTRGRGHGERTDGGRQDEEQGGEGLAQGNSGLGAGVRGPSLTEVGARLNRAMVPTAVAPSGREMDLPGQAGCGLVRSVLTRCQGQPVVRNRPTSSVSDGFVRSRSERIGLPSGVSWTAGHVTAASGSSQANPSSSLPSYAFVTR